MLYLDHQPQLRKLNVRQLRIFVWGAPPLLDEVQS